MNKAYRKSMLAAAIASLIVMPGWLAAEQADPTQPSGGQYEQPMGQSPAGAPMGGYSDVDKPLSAKTPSELDGKDVFGTDGELVGVINEIVRDPADNKIFAVISSGGFMGYWGREVVVPLDELLLVGDKLEIRATMEDLKARPEYMADRYVELEPSDRPISEFSAFESGAPK